MSSSAWVWLAKHPHREAVIRYVTGRAAAVPAPLAGGGRLAEIRRDREIMDRHRAKESARAIGRALGLSPQTVSVCVRTYKGELALPTPRGRRSVRKRAEAALTPRVVHDYRAGRLTGAQVAALLGTDSLDAVCYWIKKKAAQYGL